MSRPTGGTRSGGQPRLATRVSKYYECRRAGVTFSAPGLVLAGDPARRRRTAARSSGQLVPVTLSNSVVARVGDVVKRVSEGISRASQPLASYSCGGGFRLLLFIRLPVGSRRDSRSRFYDFSPLVASTPSNGYLSSRLSSSSVMGCNGIRRRPTPRHPGASRARSCPFPRSYSL